MKHVASVILFSLGITLLSCSILKNEDPEKNVRNFLLAFQTDLTKSNEEILAKFRVKQSQEAVLSVIGILQNKDPFVVCEASIADAQITFVNELVKIEIPSTFRLKDI